MDGSGLIDSWTTALKEAQSRFSSLVASSNSSDWKRINLPRRDGTPSKSSPRSTSFPKGKSRALVESSDVALHRKVDHRGDITRLSLDIPVENEDPLCTMASWKAVLSTPETRPEWDPNVDSSHIVEVLDPETLISRVQFSLGWPATPRDAIVISRSFQDESTYIHISTSLPRSPDEPAYLRPAPPFVRSTVHLLAWCVQLITPLTPLFDPSTSKRTAQDSPTLRLTCFRQHDLKAAWKTGGSLPQNLSDMMILLVDRVKDRGTRTPTLTGYGFGIGIDHVQFEIGRDMLRIEYSVTSDENEPTSPSSQGGIDALNLMKERRRLERSVECTLPGVQGWDIQMSIRASSNEAASEPWRVTATRTPSSSPSDVTFRVSHTRPSGHAVVKVKLSIELAGGAQGLRVNGTPHPIQETQPWSSTSHASLGTLFQGSGSIAPPSFQNASVVTSQDSSLSFDQQSRPLVYTATERSPAAEKAILTLVRRNYIYFTSLLQEPEAKWSKGVTESRGVTVTQLDSIDPTLVVYRAEAVFVGVGIWDMLSTIINAGTRLTWDKGFDDATLLEDVNELTELWHWKTKAAWPVNARDAILLKTLYKSPGSIHMFSFSSDDTTLFSVIPPLDLAVIRTQVDLQGWAIEALSPTTTLLTLLEQSDPKGWSNKSSIPQQMINTIAGVGEYAIKSGGPPMVTRMSGARLANLKFDQERETLRVEYVGCQRRGSTSTQGISQPVATTASSSCSDLSATITALDHGPEPVISSTSVASVECEIRCDVDSWSSTMEIMVDPPPRSVSCLRRHRLTSAGGLWITIEHSAADVESDKIVVDLRKGPAGAKEKVQIVVNGARVKVDTEDTPDHDLKILAKQKRVKPIRIPLDQPAALSLAQRRRVGCETPSDVESAGLMVSTSGTIQAVLNAWNGSTPRFTTPFAKLFTLGLDHPAISKPDSLPAVSTIPSHSFAPDTSPLAPALRALAYLREFHAGSAADGWVPVNPKAGLVVSRKLEPSFSQTTFLNKAEKVFEHVSPEQIVAAVTSYDARKRWDPQFSSAVTLEEYGAGCRTSFLVGKGGIALRPRGFYVASLTTQIAPPSPPPKPYEHRRTRSGSVSITNDDRSTTPRTPTTFFCVSASFPAQAVVNRGRINFNAYPIGQLLISGWIIEMMDPYTTHHALPSTRCTHILALDHGGAVPTLFNSMIDLAIPDSLKGLASYLDATSPQPIVQSPALGMILTSSVPVAINGDLGAWRMDRRDNERSLISSQYMPDNSLFTTTVLLHRRTTQPSQSSHMSSPVHSGVSRIQLDVDPPQISAPSEPAVVSISQHRAHTISLPPRRHRRSTFESVLSPSFFTTSGLGQGDRTVLEVVIDPITYKTGYEVTTTYQLCEHSESAGLAALPPAVITNSSSSPSPIDSAGNRLAVIPAVHTLPPSSICSTTRHLLVLTLPTAMYASPPLRDPLTSEVRTPLPKPEWLELLERYGCVVTIKIAPTAASHGDTFRILVNEAFVALFVDRLSEGSIPDRLMLWPTLHCSPRKADELIVPPQLAAPLFKATVLHVDGPSAPGIAPVSEVSLPTQATEQKLTKQLASSLGTKQTSSSFLGSLLSTYPIPFSPFASPPGIPQNEEPHPQLGVTLPQPTLEVDSTIQPTTLSRIIATKYSFTAMFLIAFVAFLCGSLVRSLLSPTDYIYMPTSTDAGQQAWKQISRLLDVSFPSIHIGFIIGIILLP